MPPKPAVAAERLRKELRARKARAEALKHLEATSSGPSQKELAQQQQLRQKQTANGTSAAAQRRLHGGQPQAPSAATRFDPRVRDNTLHALAVRRAQALQKTHEIEQMTESYRVDVKTTEYNALPRGWQQHMIDSRSGESYFWNETTNETMWERPGSLSMQSHAVAAAGSTTSAGHLPDGWEAVPDAASGDVYYWNRKSNETTWTRPTLRKASLVQALQAKAKLDNILKDCGKAKAVDSCSSSTTKPGKERTDPPTAASAGVASCKRRAATNECSEKGEDKRRKRSERDGETTMSME
uniref:WW domain-containing protein n=1 Tax=Peronospora matthiolae TaxID=2874970 RepID=A0AAV1T9E3_9STRA